MAGSSSISTETHTHDTICNVIVSRTVCVVGLGYVGLPLAIEFDREGFSVIGYDIDTDRVSTLSRDEDPTGEVGADTIGASTIDFYSDASSISRADYVLITVPTPIDELKNPDLRHVEAAGETIGTHLSVGATVVLESTVYPGATEEILVPAIERTSGFTSGEDFYVGYSPERMVPGDDEHGLRDVVKIVSGQNDKVLEDLVQLYGSIIDAGVHRAPEIEVAETAKCIENIQRDINIALVNELAIACNNIEIDTQDVLAAARTKWNFHDYRPGLVGGHCIPVDPFHMIYQSKRNGFIPELVEQGRKVNEYIPEFVGDLLIHGLNDAGKVLQDSTVLILGLAYKSGVGDIRTSAVNGTINRLQDFGVTVIGHDSYAGEDLIKNEFNINTVSEPDFDGVDAILVAAPHNEYLEIPLDHVTAEMNLNPLFVDVHSAFSENTVSEAGFQYKKL